MSHAHRSADLLRSMEIFRRHSPSDALKLGGAAGPSDSAAWFLGPKAENAAVLRAMIDRAVEAHCAARIDFHAGDPAMASAAAFESERYKATIGRMEEKLGQMLAHLRGSIPLASYRNQSHMYWDLTLPGLVGYVAALLYNQNNVAAEASPVTTLLEMEVGDDLCAMLGFAFPEDEHGPDAPPRPWGHITCDGSVANAESVWVARNLKYLPVSLADAIRTEAAMAPARGLTVRTLDGGRRKLLDLDSWTLLNLPVDEAIGFAPRMARAAGLAPEAVAAAMAGRTVQDVGLLDFHRRFMPDQSSPVIFAPATAHYSWAKGAALVGLGREAVRLVPVDLDGRMDTVALRAALDRCFAERRPVLQVVAVIGSTEESAVDPLAEIAAIRDERREMGQEFALHADAAWGGYFASMLRPTAVERAVRASGLQGSDEEARLTSRHVGVDLPNPLDAVEGEPLLWTPEGAAAPAMHLSSYVLRQYRALSRCETITVDPHKAGFIPYPAGALCYRNGAMREVVTFTAPVVFHGGVAPSIGVYGVEGSKPGAAAAAVWLSHSVIPADASGYGRLLGMYVFASKRFYAALLSAFGEDDAVQVTPFQRLPSERRGELESVVAEERRRLRDEIAPFPNDVLLEKLARDPTLLDLFRDMGSDQSIVAYAFNLRVGGALNDEPDLMNALNDAIFQRLSVQRFEGDRLPRNPMFVTASQFDPSVYGQDFVDAFARRAGLRLRPDVPIRFLISTQQNPFLTCTAEGDFTPKVVSLLRDAATEAASEIRKKYCLDAPRAAG